MDVKFRVTGYNEVMARLKYITKTVPESARKSMHRAADRIVKQAKINAPRDKANLEESIRKEVKYGYQGRLNIQIVMGGVVNGVNVDEYAVEVHENYDDAHPGPTTEYKRTLYPGEYIGGKFLERAIDKYAPSLPDTIKADVERTIKDAD